MTYCYGDSDYTSKGGSFELPPFFLLVYSLPCNKKLEIAKTKALAPITVVPGLFNINEPTMFGIPVVLNVMLVIPFILAPMINVVVTYFAMASGIVPLTRAAASWTMPPIFSGFLVTGDINGAICRLF